MGYIFDIGDTTVWSPSLRAGRLYVLLLEAIAEATGRPSGLNAIADDMYEIDLAFFKGLVNGLVQDYFSTEHPIQRKLLHGVLLASLVIVERGGEPIDAASEDQDALLAEAHTCGRSMPT